jgi:hypothetical protein
MTAILYFSKEDLGARNTSPVFSKTGAFVGFVRAELVEEPDLSEALDLAKPRRGEVVLNSVEAAV